VSWRALWGWVAGVLSALPDFGLAFAFLMTWTSPGWLGGRPIRYLMLVMMVEFVIVHSAGFMAGFMASDLPRATKSLWILGLSGFYTIFVGAFAVAFRTWWPITGFWLLTVNRLSGVLLSQAPAGRGKQLAAASWGVGALLYVVLVFATVFLPVPRLGISPAVAQAADLLGTGLWVDEPHRVLAFGFLYFTAMALWELTAHRWVATDATAS
jgi:hypothetical protein